MKKWLQAHRNAWILGVLLAAVLAGAFWYGGDAAGLRGWDAGPGVSSAVPASSQDASASQTEVPQASASQADTSQAAAASAAETGEEGKPAGAETEEKTKASARSAANAGSSSGAETGGSPAPKPQAAQPEEKDAYGTVRVPDKPAPVEPQNAVITDKECTCTLSISCADILAHLDELDPEKKDLVPEDGWILEPTQVTFYEGESVLNVLVRTCKQQSIHMEYRNTPIYNSAYIEGIQNLYEFDCGELSGWIYLVNGWSPNYGCSRYALQDGDTVEWEYTCARGSGEGYYYSAGD